MSAAATVAFVGAVPFVLFDGLFADAVATFRWEAGYILTGWAPFILMMAGTLWFVPVVLSLGRTGYSRLYLRPVTRSACQAWGLVTYLLGFCLAIQASSIAGLF
ncbi:MAG TPA: hypothetical protein VF715_10330 [Thermoleophilaceae bacterium]|jgi:hypothetical protein